MSDVGYLSPLARMRGEVGALARRVRGALHESELMRVDHLYRSGSRQGPPVPARGRKRGEGAVGAIHRTIYQYGALVRSTAAPRRYTAEIRRVLVMSSSGLALSTMKSALLPG